jgi:hypothetical protein
MRSISEPFVVARPAGARIRTRLRLTAADEAVVRSVGNQLGHLAGADLAWRCRLGQGSDERVHRKRALTGQSSSRWAGAITRTSSDQWQRAVANLGDRRILLRRAVTTIQRRLAVPVGQRRGRVRGYASQAERYSKQGRLQHLQAALAEVDGRLASGRVSVCRGGSRLAKLRHGLSHDDFELTVAEWRARWQAERWFLTADGEAATLWGNQTIRVHPDLQWCAIKLPLTLAHLSNTPGRAITYRLSCPVGFTHRKEEWAAQTVTGAVRYDISYQPDRGRWYLDASWKIKRGHTPSLAELRQHRALGVDLNADHLACWVLDESGNPTGPPHTIPLMLAGLPASTRNGQLRAAITAIVHLATASSCRSIVVENLDFTNARQVGRETLGRGARGKRFRRVIAEIPTRKFRDLLNGMAANADLWIIAVDPGWTSVWGRQYWQVSSNQSTKPSIIVTGHHAAAVVIARRGLGMGARRRPGVTCHDQRIVAGELPARPGQQSPSCEGPGPPARPSGSGSAAQDPRGRREQARRPGGSGPFGTTGAGPIPAQFEGTVCDQELAPV